MGDDWSPMKVSRESDEYMNTLGLPKMKKPVGLGAEYFFPDDPRTLSGIELGALQLKLTGYYTYLLGIIAKDDADVSTFSSFFELKLAVAMAERTSTTKMTKEVLRGYTVDNDEYLTKLYRTIEMRQNRLVLLKAQAEIYRDQATRLSREQSRRESEASVYR